MGYELIWQPLKKSWAIYSTAICKFVAEGLETPDAVADYIVGPDEYYYTEFEGERLIARAEFKSRDEIIRYYEKEIAQAKDCCWTELTKKGWVEHCIPAEQVKRNLERVYGYSLAKWDAGAIRPNPKAKEELRQMWKEEAERVRREGRMILEVTRCQITPRGLEPLGREIQGPEKW